MPRPPKLQVFGGTAANVSGLITSFFTAPSPEPHAGRPAGVMNRKRGRPAGSVSGIADTATPHGKRPALASESAVSPLPLDIGCVTPAGGEGGCEAVQKPSCEGPCAGTEADVAVPAIDCGDAGAMWAEDELEPDVPRKPGELGCRRGACEDYASQH